ncbi:helix-turn-helix domain-containing protein [Streptomyces radicis]|uniref:Helix-turn-helix domain-containing protein n=2 Tax=Streptomyces radicis TaxID=1750517 RepID=A0A3A9W2P6_9ACTN|nr:helix-turn-helix domain-containing protein [Streptomyces radicis]RKN19619.1 helix-turn-helix domain-containing protein [Streptomyces radicis]
MSKSGTATGADAPTPGTGAPEPGRAEVEAVSNERLGARLRELRLGSGKSLRALARELGISASAVSQIERGALRPSVSRLIAIVTALDVPLAAVFDASEAGADEGDPGPIAIRRAWEVAPVFLDGGVVFRRLSPAPVPDVEFFESTYPPGSVSNAHRQFLKHEGYEVGTVTEGELTIEFDAETVTLRAGDSITYPCRRPHIISNRSETATAVATWLIIHR